jgi:hypothetical protein
MHKRLRIECGPKDQSGRRPIVASCGGFEHRDYFQTEIAFLRTRFAETALNKFGGAITADVLNEIDDMLLKAADEADRRHQRAAGAKADAVRLTDVPPAQVQWLWPNRVALGKLTLLAGDPGLGKSLVTLDMAARVSRGAAWPDEEEHAAGSHPEGTRQGMQTVAASSTFEATSSEPVARGSVLLLSAEDDLADTIRPRLEAHGADCARIVAIRAISSEEADGQYSRAFDLDRDLEHLEAELARMEQCRLIVIDPISAYLGCGAENMNAEVRSLLHPLTDLAAKRNVAVVAVTHLRKAEGSAMRRSIGSMAFVAASRTAWLVSRDPHDAHRRLLLPVKNNLSADTYGLAYTIESRGPGRTAVVCWSEDTVEMSADEALNRPSLARDESLLERCQAEAWLHEFLAGGPQPASEVRNAAEAQGFSYATLRRAFRDVGGEAIREGNEGLKPRWVWRLPAAQKVV